MNNDMYLAHFGIKGQKWGVRNYQNEDGTLTAAGRARYLKGMSREERHDYLNSDPRSRAKAERYMDQGMSYGQAKEAVRRDTNRRRIALGAAAVGTALAAYGAYKITKNIKAKAYLNGLLYNADKGKLSSFDDIARAHSFSGGRGIKLKDAYRRNRDYKQAGVGIYARENKGSAIQKLANNILTQREANKYYGARKDLSRYIDNTKNKSNRNKLKRLYYSQRARSAGSKWLKKMAAK